MARPKKAAMPTYEPYFSTWSWSESARRTMKADASLGGGPVGSVSRGGRGQDDGLLRLEPQARELGHDGGEPGWIALEREQPDAVEGLLHPGGVDARTIGPEDPVGRGRLRALVGVEELLVELLAGA